MIQRFFCQYKLHTMDGVSGTCLRCGADLSSWTIKCLVGVYSMRLYPPMNANPSQPYPIPGTDSIAEKPTMRWMWRDRRGQTKQEHKTANTTEKEKVKEKKKQIHVKFNDSRQDADSRCYHHPLLPLLPIPMSNSFVAKKRRNMSSRCSQPQTPSPPGSQARPPALTAYHRRAIPCPEPAEADPRVYVVVECVWRNVVNHDGGHWVEKHRYHTSGSGSRHILPMSEYERQVIVPAPHMASKLVDTLVVVSHNITQHRLAPSPPPP